MPENDRLWQKRTWLSKAEFGGKGLDVVDQANIRYFYKGRVRTVRISVETVTIS